MKRSLSLLIAVALAGCAAQPSYAADSIYANGFEGPLVCPSVGGIQTRGNARWFSPAKSRTGVDFTSYRQTFGYDSSTSSTVEFPSHNNAVFSMTLNKASYIAIKFTVPLGLAANTYGQWTTTQTGATAPVSLYVSECPGKTVGVPATCRSLTNGEGGGVVWNLKGGAGYCQFTPGKTYYLTYTFINSVTGENSCEQVIAAAVAANASSGKAVNSGNTTSCSLGVVER